MLLCLEDFIVTEQIVWSNFFYKVVHEFGTRESKSSGEVGAIVLPEILKWGRIIECDRHRNCGYLTPVFIRYPHGR